jgi:hypothetical protein
MPAPSDLLSEDPAWPLVKAWIAAATHRVEVLAARDPDRTQALVELRVTTRSTMGAVVYETGGLLIDDGWLRVLGSGNPRLPRTLPGWNHGRSWLNPEASPPFLIVADDALGRSFAIDGGALGGKPGDVHYFAPDSLRWESLEGGYSDFLRWALSGKLDDYYGGLRWRGWRDEVQPLPGDRAFMIYPPLWAKGPAIEGRDRHPVRMAELFAMQLDVAQQLAGAT